MNENASDAHGYSDEGMGQDDGISRISHLIGVASGVAFALRYARVGGSATPQDSFLQQQSMTDRSMRERPGEYSARQATGKPS